MKRDDFINHHDHHEPLGLGWFRGILFSDNPIYIYVHDMCIYIYIYILYIYIYVYTHINLTDAKCATPHCWAIHWRSSKKPKRAAFLLYQLYTSYNHLEPIHTYTIL